MNKLKILDIIDTNIFKSNNVKVDELIRGSYQDVESLTRNTINCLHKKITGKNWLYTLKHNYIE